MQMWKRVVLTILTILIGAFIGQLCWIACCDVAYISDGGRLLNPENPLAPICAGLIVGLLVTVIFPRALLGIFTVLLSLFTIRIMDVFALSPVLDGVARQIGYFATVLIGPIAWGLVAGTIAAVILRRGSLAYGITPVLLVCAWAWLPFSNAFARAAYATAGQPGAPTEIASLGVRMSLLPVCMLILGVLAAVGSQILVGRLVSRTPAAPAVEEEDRCI